ncbi:hypothetical protein C8Q70DRAFT_952169 [Cubamyces menziesii]|nr:hypothetical protein C8Q70DRAFT_952169 [Cubamyces menziesii]
MDLLFMPPRTTHGHMTAFTQLVQTSHRILEVDKQLPSVCYAHAQNMALRHSFAALWMRVVVSASSVSIRTLTIYRSLDTQPPSSSSHHLPPSSQLPHFFYTWLVLMFSVFASLPFRRTRDAGRRKSDYIKLDDYTDPAVPPSPTGWTWCESMRVWLPEDLNFSSGLILGNNLPCNRCRPPAPSRPKLVQRLTSTEYWRLPRKSRKSRKNVPIVTDWSVVQASGVTFSQIQLQDIKNFDSPCCGSSLGGLPRQYLF